MVLHHARGPDIPERPARPGTWPEVRAYGLQILHTLQELARDPEAPVREAAQTSLIDAFRVFVRYSRLPDALHELGRRAFAGLEEVATRAPGARLRARIATQLELVLDDLSRAPEEAGTSEAAEHARRLLANLTEDSFKARLWRWVGPGSLEVDVKRLQNDPAVSKALESLARDLVTQPNLLAEHIAWLVGDEAEQRISLFNLLGEADQGERLFPVLLGARHGTYWPVAFGAYCVGWSGKAPGDVDRTLDGLLDDAALHRGILIATAWLPPSRSAVDRLIRLAASGSMPRSEAAREVAWTVQWDRLTASETKRLLRALDDGTAEVRSELLHAPLVRHGRGAGLTPGLADLAWSFLGSTLPTGRRTGPHAWDALAATLGKQEPGRLLDLVERVLRASASAEDRTMLDHHLPLAWRTLQNTDRQGVLRMLLRLAMASDAPWWISWHFSEMIDPGQDCDVLVSWTEEAGVEGAHLVAESLDADRPGFWDLARELILRWSGDERLTEQLLARLHTGIWSGSAVPMIDRRLAGARALLKDSDVHVAAWARKAVTQLEEWRRREERQDEEEWIWDYKIQPSSSWHRPA